jgi:preprotein translocase subunit YajC
MGNTHLLAAATKSSSTSLLPIIIIVVLFMLVYMTMTRRSRARQAQQQQTGIVPGTSVRTTSGMYGTVTSVVDNDDVMVEVSPGVNIRMMKRAVVPVPPDASAGVPPEPAPETEPAEDESATPSADDHEQRADDWNPQDRNI